MCSTSSLVKQMKYHIFNTKCMLSGVHSDLMLSEHFKRIKHNIINGSTTTYSPKLNEVPKICSSYKKAVEQRICQEQHEKLVVGESHTVVNPASRVNKRKQISVGKCYHEYKFKCFRNADTQLITAEQRSCIRDEFLGKGLQPKCDRNCFMIQ